MKTFFKKLEYYFLVETTKIENISFPFKTAIFPCEYPYVISIMIRKVVRMVERGGWGGDRVKGANAPFQILAKICFFIYIKQKSLYHPSFLTYSQLKKIVLFLQYSAEIYKITTNTLGKEVSV